MTGRGTIVVGVDGSSHARRAAREAARRGLPLRLIHMCSTPVGLPGGLIEPAVVRDAWREQGRRLLDEAGVVAREVSGDLRLGVVLIAASVVPAMVKAARTASLVVLGTRGPWAGSPSC